MQDDEHNPADTIRAPGSDHEESSDKVQLSANTTRRLEKLAQWRIDPSFLKFPEGTPEFEGAYAKVSRALLGSSPNDATDQVVESSPGNLKSSDHIPRLEGENRRREAEGSNEEARKKGEGGAEGLEHESDGETSGRLRVVAVKKMKMKTPNEVVQVLGLALREAEFLAKLSHKNVLKLKGFAEDASKNVIWLIFPWEANGTLKDFVASCEWEIPERISLIYEVASGVEYLRSREPPICHGDLKSINILVNSKCIPVITDFGSAYHPVAKSSNEERERIIKEPQPAPSLEATHSPSTNTITLTCKHYTTRWAAPELLKEEDAGLPSDVWALGCVVYEVMTNSIPFQNVLRDTAVVLRVVRGDLPSISSETRMLLIQALCSLVGRCWKMDPSERATAEDCRKTIEWMPLIVPNPARTADTADITGYSALLLMKLGSMHFRQNDYRNASKYFTEALGVYTNLSDNNGKANAVLQLAQIHRLQDEYDESVTSYSDALNIYTDTGDKPGRASALWGLAEVHRARNNFSKAAKLYSECLQIRTDIGDNHGRASALEGLAEVHRSRNDFSQAITFYSECLRVRTNIGDRGGRASALEGLAEVHRTRSNYDQAITFYSECLQVWAEIGERGGRASALEGLAEVHRARKEYAEAVTFYSECLQIRNDIGDRKGKADVLLGLAKVHRAQDEYSQAVAFYTECLQISSDIDYKRGRAETLFGLAEVHRAQHKYGRAMTSYFNAVKSCLT